MKFSPVDWIFVVLLVVGGLNWGLVGLLNFDLVATIFGAMSLLSRVVYTLVGLSAAGLAISLVMKSSSVDYRAGHLPSR